MTFLYHSKRKGKEYYLHFLFPRIGRKKHPKNIIGISVETIYAFFPTEFEFFRYITEGNDRDYTFRFSILGFGWEVASHTVPKAYFDSEGLSITKKAWLWVWYGPEWRDKFKS